MSALADSIPIVAMTEAADRRRRIIAIVGASSGNLVEWYDFYAYAFTSIYFASAFFPSGDATSQLLATAGIFAVGFFFRNHWWVGASAPSHRPTDAGAFGWRGIWHCCNLHERGSL